jgi:hypothetical protein
MKLLGLPAMGRSRQLIAATHSNERPSPAGRTNAKGGTARRPSLPYFKNPYRRLETFEPTAAMMQRQDL